MTNGHSIGIDRRLDIEWLDAVAVPAPFARRRPEPDPHRNRDARH